MFVLLAKLKQVREYVALGEYENAGRLVYEIVGELTGWSGRAAAEGTVTELEACREECEALVADCAGRGAGGVIALALLQLFGPTLVELVKKIIENRKA